MNVSTIRFDRLSTDDLSAWDSIQRNNPALDSPFFRPEFAGAVASVRDDVEIAVVKDGGRSVGFLPFHRLPWNAGTPLGGVVSDFHGVISPAGVDHCPVELIRAAGLGSFKFNRLVCDRQVRFEDHVRDELSSPYIDLSDGFDAYIESRDNGRRILKQVRRKKKGLERRVGPIRFEAHSDDREVLETCVRWKTEQYHRTGVPNVLAPEWVVLLLETILETKSADFAPMFSVLYAGDQIASIDVGMRSRNVWHPWFCVYNVDMEKYSPGIIHLVDMMKEVPQLGIERIDLSAGGESYKYRFMSGERRVGCGAVDARLATATARRVWWRARDVVRSSPLAGPARIPARLLYRLNHWYELRRPGLAREAQRRLAAKNAAQ